MARPGAPAPTHEAKPASAAGGIRCGESCWGSGGSRSRPGRHRACLDHITPAWPSLRSSLRSTWSGSHRGVEVPETGPPPPLRPSADGPAWVDSPGYRMTRCRRVGPRRLPLCPSAPFDSLRRLHPSPSFDFPRLAGLAGRPPWSAGRPAGWPRLIGRPVGRREVAPRLPGGAAGRPVGWLAGVTWRATSRVAPVLRRRCAGIFSGNFRGLE